MRVTVLLALSACALSGCGRPLIEPMGDCVVVDKYTETFGNVAGLGSRSVDHLACRELRTGKVYGIPVSGKAHANAKVGDVIPGSR